jgi:hypothetical protein
MENDLRRVIGGLPYRAALAGGWIDQPFVSRLNPTPPGSMVVVGLEPDFYWMDRCGMGTSTRQVARRLWGDSFPGSPGSSTGPREPDTLVRELYHAENEGKDDPSGSQDMAGLIYPGINRLDYDASIEGGYFPAHVESNTDPAVASWLEAVLYVLPVNQRPVGYSPLEIQNLDPEWVRRLGQTGRDCYSAIVRMDAPALGAAFNECMLCWEALLPQTVRHPLLTVDLVGLMRSYQARYAGAMYSGCGGGYLYVISDEPVPGALKVKVRL